MVSGLKLPLWWAPHPDSSSSLSITAVSLRGSDLWGETPPRGSGHLVSHPTSGGTDCASTAEKPLSL